MAKTQASNGVALLRQSILERGYCGLEELDRVLEGWRQAGAELSVLPGMLVRQGLLTTWQLEQVRQFLPDAAGTLVIPGYQVLEKLGAGGAAAVYRARQLSLDRDVAIKVLHRLKADDKAMIARLHAEGKAAAKLNHPNIVQAYDVGWIGDCPYFVMEYVQGSTVFEQLCQRGRIDAKEAVGVITQITRALAHAHEQGLVHCDIKPHNVVITASGQAKLADLGLARSVYDQEMRQPGKPYGTPYYISPEQIRGQGGIDGRADVYSLGCTFYHMVTGKVPFEGESAGAVMRQHLLTPLIPPDHVCKAVPVGVAVVIEMMMAKDPANRHAGAGQLLEDLEALGRGDMPIHARRQFSMEGIEHVEPEDSQGQLRVYGSGRSLLRDPLFWMLIVSLGMNLVLLLAMVR